MSRPMKPEQLRVKLCPSGAITTINFGAMDKSGMTTYDSKDDLPQWIKERIAVLMVAGDNPGTEVKGVGEWLLPGIFYVDVPTGITTDER